jgi:hypothetical protein
MYNSYKIEGAKAFGQGETLLEQQDNLIANTDWAQTGFTMEYFLDEEYIQALRSGLCDVVINALKKEGIHIPEGFKLEHYHHYVPDKQSHLKVIEHTKAIDYTFFPIAPAVMVDRISKAIGMPLTTLNPNTGENIFHLRIVRPDSSDYNPLHRDAWLDELKGSVNLYVPIAGSNESSSLFLVPGSHLWPESEVERTLEGAVMNGAKYNVPGLTGSRKNLDMIRPNPGYNEVLIFSPYLIHGGATNLNKDQTRISLEVRLWRSN